MNSSKRKLHTNTIVICRLKGLKDQVPKGGKDALKANQKTKRGEKKNGTMKDKLKIGD